MGSHGAGTDWVAIAVMPFSAFCLVNEGATRDAKGTRINMFVIPFFVATVFWYDRPRLVRRLCLRRLLALPSQRGVVKWTWTSWKVLARHRCLLVLLRRIVNMRLGNIILLAVWK